jgi:hypothetical protein
VSTNHTAVLNAVIAQIQANLTVVNTPQFAVYGSRALEVMSEDGTTERRMPRRSDQILQVPLPVEQRHVVPEYAPSEASSDARSIASLPTRGRGFVHTAKTPVERVKYHHQRKSLVESSSFVSNM